MDLRAATYSDFKTVKIFFDEGRAFQNSLGFIQWLEGYPTEDLFRADCDLNRGFVIENDGVPVGYVVIDLTGDPEYDRLARIWNYSGRYAVVHRMVLGDKMRGKGLSHELLNKIEDYVSAQHINIIRFDTGLKNLPMQRLLTSAGYINVGTHEFVWGPRFAYERKIR